MILQINHMQDDDVLWSLTRAAVKLLLLQDNELSYSVQPVITIKITDTTQGETSDRGS